MSGEGHKNIQTFGNEISFQTYSLIASPESKLPLNSGELDLGETIQKYTM